jgi:hypothetical protein
MRRVFLPIHTISFSVGLPEIQIYLSAFWDVNNFNSLKNSGLYNCNFRCSENVPSTQATLFFSSRHLIGLQ